MWCVLLHECYVVMVCTPLVGMALLSRARSRCHELVCTSCVFQDGGNRQHLPGRPGWRNDIGKTAYGRFVGGCGIAVGIQGRQVECLLGSPMMRAPCGTRGATRGSSSVKGPPLAVLHMWLVNCSTIRTAAGHVGLNASSPVGRVLRLPVQSLRCYERSGLAAIMCRSQAAHI